MKQFKVAALVMCFFMLISIFACNNDIENDQNDTAEEITAETSQFIDPYSELAENIAVAMNTFPPDTVMLSAGDYSVTWGSFYFILHDTVSRITGNFSVAPDWNEETPDGLFNEILLQYVIDQAVQSMVLNYGINDIGVTVNEESMEFFQSVIDTRVSAAISPDSLEDELKLEGFMSIEIFEAALMEFILQDQLQYDLLDMLLAEIHDSEVEQYAHNEGFMSSKHILIQFPGDDPALTEDEIEAEKEAAFERISEIYDDLVARINDEDFEEYFTSIMTESGEDPGAIPDGYLFRYLDMVEPFSEAAAELEPGEMSGIVETLYGFHIILRTHLDFDSMVPIEYASYGQYVTLRQLAVTSQFGNKYDEWEGKLDIVYSPELDTIDVAELFAWIG